jgi:signal transduction histidine kinase/ligand-binding sensor domain-containing protein
MRSQKLILASAGVCLLLLAGSACVHAEQLPLKTYTIADGLARDSVNWIMQDSLGFLWFCTSEGLSRFDGYTFTNYGVDQGLPSRELNYMIEAHDGVYWIATSDGLVCFNPRRAATTQPAQAEPMFVVYRPSEHLAREFTVLLEDRAGVIWCGTRGGLFKFTSAGSEARFDRVGLGESPDMNESLVTALVEDYRGAIWVGTEYLGLIRLGDDGSRARFTSNTVLPADHVTGIIEDRERELWVSTTSGLVRLANDSIRPVAPERTYTSRDGLSFDFVGAVFQIRDGHIWLSSGGGVTEIDPHVQSGGIRKYRVGHGATNDNITSYCEDRDGNLWLGSESGGATKIARNGFITYREVDGLSSGRIAGIGENRQGDLVVLAANSVNAFSDRRFSATRFNLPKGWAPSWGWNQAEFQDHLGDWWAPATRGVCRFPSDGHQAPRPQAKACLTLDEKGAEVFRLFEDSHGDIWLSVFSNASPLARWDRASGRIERYTQIDSRTQGAPTAFREDRAGNLWMSPYNGGLVRYRDGKFTFFGMADGVPLGFIRDLYLDHSGRLWIATTQAGVGRVDDPEAEHPRFINLTTAEGLASNQATCFAEDKWGRIYVGTGRGVDQLEPATNHIKHFTTADGLADNFINVAFADRQGDLWFGTLQGLSQLVPEPESARAPPMIRIGALRVAGALRKLPELGASDFSLFDLAPDQNQVQINFFSIGFTPGETLRYQYMLKGTDRDWSASTTQRSVNYSGLAPGSYRFLVRAIDANGLPSEQPATISFRILPPVWRRWWFVALAALFVLSGTFSLVRYRLARLRERSDAEQALRQSREERFRELERVRKRIASDLHDEIGSSLTQISLLSEVVQQRIDGKDPAVTAPLATIATSSRELVDSMSDIVWAINPKKDHLSDLVQRMRSLASEVFTACDVKFRFLAPAANINLPLGANLRREVFLTYKESINNIVKHSRCSEADVELRVDADRLVLKVSDNGKGFEAAQESGGHGLISMRDRAQQMGGTLQMMSATGQGTTIVLQVPLRDVSSDFGLVERKSKSRQPGRLNRKAPTKVRSEKSEPSA